MPNTWRINFKVTNLMPSNMPKINSNIHTLLTRLGNEAVTSAQRSIQRKRKPAAKGRPPRDVTGKLKAGIDSTVRNNVLWIGVRPAQTNPPPGSRKRGVVKWLEANHPFLGPAFKRAHQKLRSLISSFSLTRR